MLKKDLLVPTGLFSFSFSKEMMSLLVTKHVKTVVDGQVVTLGEVQVDDGIRVSPELSLSTESVSFNNSDSTTIEVSRMGDGAISAILSPEIADYCSVSVSGTTVTITGNGTNTDDVTGTLRIVVAETGDYYSEYKDVSVTLEAIHQVTPSLILRAWMYNDFFFYDTNVSYYKDYYNITDYYNYSDIDFSKIPELMTDSIYISDARYLGGEPSYYFYISVETNSDGVVSVSGNASSYVSLSSQGNGKYLIVVTDEPSYSDGSRDTRSLVISIGETNAYIEVSRTLSITFQNGWGPMEPT